MRGPRVSVIIATWNACGVLGACLDSLDRQQVDGGFETIVVDNASTDATAELLRRYEDRVRVIANDRNEGFGAANNQAARVARGEVLFFLNPDTALLGAGVLEAMERTVADPVVGLAGPMLVNPDGSLQPSCAAHPSIARALLVGTGAHRLLPPPLLARVAPDRWAHDRPADAGWLMGAALAVRTEVFHALGGFWSQMYAEDQDLAWRAQERGWRVRFEPSARVMHVGNHSAAQRWSPAARAARVASSELTFLRAHTGPLRGAAIRAIVGTGYAARAVAHAVLGHRERAGVYRALARTYAAGTLAR